MVDALGVDKTHLNYDAFGNVLEVTGTDPTAPRFTYVGQEFDPDTGLYYYENPIGGVALSKRTMCGKKG